MPEYMPADVGTVHEFGTPEYDALLPPEKRKPGSRAVIMIDVDKVGTVCGFQVTFPLHYLQTLPNRPVLRLLSPLL